MRARATKEGWPLEVSSCLIGSCTNSSYEDMAKCAHLTKQALDAGLKFKVPFYVTPGSRAVQLNIEKEGFVDTFERAGATVLAKACGPCIGQWKRKMPPGVKNTIVTSYNRNFAQAQRRQPRHARLRHLARADDHARLRGRRSTSTRSPTRSRRPSGEQFRFALPENVLSMPASSWDTDLSIFQSPVVAAGEPPPPTCRSPSTRRPSASSCSSPSRRGTGGLRRLPRPHQGPRQVHHRPHLDGRPVAQVPRPPHQHLRQHAHRRRQRGDEARPTPSPTSSPARSARSPTSAREYRDAGVKWIVVGDKNYGEGSSREHAALEPRHLGGVAVLVRSFARIHETNLKKQGMLPLTFAEPADYERLTGHDKLSILGLASLAPGVPLTVRVTPAAGEPYEIQAAHTFNPEQIEWFRHGSALNLMKAQMAKDVQ